MLEIQLYQYYWPYLSTKQKLKDLCISEYQCFYTSNTNTDTSINIREPVIPMLVLMLEIQQYQYLVLEAKVSLSDSGTNSIAHLWAYYMASLHNMR